MPRSSRHREIPVVVTRSPRWWSMRWSLAVRQVLVDPADDLGVVLDQVDISGGGQVGMTKDDLDVAHGQPLVPAHPDRRRVPQVVHRPVRAQQRVDPPEHCP